MSKFCSNCGKEVSESVKFCSECGSPVNENCDKEKPQTAQQGSFTVTITRESFWLGETSLYIDNNFISNMPNQTTISEKLSAGVHTFTITCGGKWSQQFNIDGNKTYLLKMHRSVGGLYLEEVHSNGETVHTVHTQPQQPIYVKLPPFSGMSITGFVLSFLTIIPTLFVLGMAPDSDAIGFALIGFVIAAISVIFSTLGLRKMYYEELRGKGLSIAGNIISGFLALFLLIMLYGIMNW